MNTNKLIPGIIIYILFLIGYIVFVSTSKNEWVLLLTISTITAVIIIDLIVFVFKRNRWISEFTESKGGYICTGQVSNFLELASVTDLKESEVNIILKYLLNYEDSLHFRLYDEVKGGICLEVWEYGINQPIAVFMWYHALV